MVPLVLIFLIPSLISPVASVPDETWGITPGEVYQYTMGYDLDITLPGGVWDKVNESLWMGIEEMFNNTWEIGYRDGYPIGYDDGFNQTEDNRPAEPDWYDDEYDDYETGLWDGYWTGFWHGSDDNYSLSPYLNNYYNDYENETLHPGFNLADEMAFDGQSVVEGMLLLPSIVNMELTVEGLDTITKFDDYGHYEPHYYEDWVWFNEGDWVWDYYNYEYDYWVDGYYAPADDMYLVGVWHDYDMWVVDGYNQAYFDQINMSMQIKYPGESMYYSMEDFALNYLRNTLVPYFAGALPGQVATEFVDRLNYVAEELENETLEPDYDSEFTNFSMMQWFTGSDKSIMDMHLEEQIGFFAVSGLGISTFTSQDYFPLFIPTTTNVGMAFEDIKDGINRMLVLSHGTAIGGFNGIVDQAGIEIVANEKEFYVGADLADAEFMFGALADLGGTLLIDEINEFAGDLLDNSSLAANAVADWRWDAAGVLQNFHYEVHASADDYISQLLGLGVNLIVDISEGESLLLAQGYTGKPVQDHADYAPTVDENWGVTEGDAIAFTVGGNYKVELPQAIWDRWNEQMYEGMNYSYARNNYDYGWYEGYREGYESGWQGWEPWERNGGFLQEEYTAGWNDAIWIGHDDGRYDREQDNMNWTDYMESYNNIHEDYVLTGLPAGESVDMHVMLESIIDNIPSTLNLQSTITDMFTMPYNYYEQEWNGVEWVDVPISSSYDMLLSSFMAKLPAEADYRPIGTLFTDFYDGVIATIDESFPPTYADLLIAELEDFNVGNMQETIAGNVSIFDIVSQFIPTVPFMWGAESTDTDIPDWAKDLGIVDDMFINHIENGYAIPSMLYVPTDTNFGTTFDEFMAWAQIQDPSFTENFFNEFMANASIDNFIIEGNEVKIVWIVNGVNDIFFDTTGLAQNVRDWIADFNTEFGIMLDENSLVITATFTLGYDVDGILNNFHTQFGISIDDGGVNEFDLAVEFDISQGEFASINQLFPGQPLIEVYDHWVDPDADFSVFVPAGSHTYSLESGTDGIDMDVDFTAVDDVTISIQAWGSNPSDDDPGFEAGSGAYFAIDVDNEDAITFPITVTIGIPSGFETMTAPEIVDIFAIYVWDSATNTWEAETGFTVTVDLVAGTIAIEITHLSVFAVGIEIPEDPTDDPTGGFQIPGYSLWGLLIASLGAMAYVTKKRK